MVTPWSGSQRWHAGPAVALKALPRNTDFAAECGVTIRRHRRPAGEPAALPIAQWVK
jgi:hypothetical protein